MSSYSQRLLPWNLLRGGSGADCGLRGLIEGQLGRALKNRSRATFAAWRQQRNVKLHFCSLHVVCCTWNSQAIGDAANNEGPCPGKP